MHPDGKYIFKHYFLAFSVQNIIKKYVGKFTSRHRWRFCIYQAPIMEHSLERSAIVKAWVI